LKNFVLSGIAALAIVSAAQSEPAASTSSKSDAAGVIAGPAAKAFLDKLNNELVAAHGLSYTSVLYYVVPGVSSESHVTKQALTQVAVDRPANFLIRASNVSGLLAVVDSNGSMFTVYDALSGKYSSAPTHPDLPSTLGAFANTAQAVFTTTTESGQGLRAAVGFPLGFLNGQIDIAQAPPGATLSYTLEPMIFENKAAKKVTETLNSPGAGSLSIEFIVDTSNNLPLAQVIQGIPPGTATPVTVLKELYSNFKLFTSASLAAAFAYTPPSSATLVAALTPQLAPVPPSDNNPPTPAPNAEPPSMSVPAPPAPGAGPGGGGGPGSPPPGGPIGVAPGSPAPVKPLPPAPPI
jgi:hypothetical protein